MQLKEEAYSYHKDEYDGYCVECDDITNCGGVEPDAERYECDMCGKRKVMGIENALVRGFIDII